MSKKVITSEERKLLLCLNKKMNELENERKHLSETDLRIERCNRVRERNHKLRLLNIEREREKERQRRLIGHMRRVTVPTAGNRITNSENNHRISQRIQSTKFSFSRKNRLAHITEQGHVASRRTGEQLQDGSFGNCCLNRVLLKNLRSFNILYNFIEKKSVKSNTSYFGIFDPTKIRFQREDSIHHIGSQKFGFSWGLNLSDGTMYHKGVKVTKILPRKLIDNDIITIHVAMKGSILQIDNNPDSSIKSQISFDLNGNEVGETIDCDLKVVSACFSIGDENVRFTVGKEDCEVIKNPLLPYRDHYKNISKQDVEERILYLLNSDDGDLTGDESWFDFRLSIMYGNSEIRFFKYLFM